MTYNGHKNWNHWNVSLWLFNDEGLYSLVQKTRLHTRDKAARRILEMLSDCGITETPDGAPYTFTSIRAALAE